MYHSCATYTPRSRLRMDMSKKASSFELALGPPPSGQQKSRWLYAALKSAILAGQIPAGTRIPSTRAIGEAFQMARGTVVDAFELLLAEGYLRSETGSGTWIAPLRTRLDVAQAVQRPVREARTGTGHLSERSRVFREFHFATSKRRVDTTLFPYYPALDLFPLDIWRQTASKRMRRLDTASMTNQHPLGFLPLREAIADYLRLSRGISCTAERIALVNGVQQALDIVVRLVADPGDTAVVEDPCYPGAVAVLTAAGLCLEPLPVDREGLQIQLAKHSRGNARLAFVTPAHQAPLGVIMSAQRRIELLAWAQRNDAVIFEDDYDSEFRYSGWPVPALGAQDGSKRVITFGAFTKTLFPSLRIGYVVLPDWLVEPFQGAISITARYPEPTMQQVLFDFIVQGHYVRHIQRMRTRYAERRQFLAREIEAKLGSFMRLDQLGDGIATIGWLRKTSAAHASRLALRHNLVLVALSRYVVAHRRAEGLVLGFANAKEATLPQTMNRLKRVLVEASRR